MNISVKCYCRIILIVFCLAGCTAFVPNEPIPARMIERPFEWYRTQMDTGPASANNCGPSCLSMIIKYFNSEDVPVAEVREENPRDNGWWYASDISAALNYYGIQNRVQKLSSEEALFAALGKGNIVLVCVDMSLLSPEDGAPETKFNRFYEKVTGHFLVLKGYSEQREWIVAYDSNSWKKDYYKDGGPKGKDRYYQSEEMLASMEEWWPYFFEIIGTEEIVAKRSLEEGWVDFRSSMEGIPDAWGK